MTVTPVYDVFLLAEISKAKKISYQDLWKKFSDTSETIFDMELATLASMGCIKIVDDVIVFI